MWLCLLQVVSLSEDKMGGDCNSDSMPKWKDLTQKQQQKYYDSRPNLTWNDCKLSDTDDMKKIIWFALCDFSEKEPVGKITNKCQKHTNKIFGSIEKSMKKHEDETICMSLLFVLAKAGDYYWKFPVIKLSKRGINNQQHNNIFIDFCGRVYKNWQDYLKNNTLPNRILCYPKNGVYSAVNGVVEVEYGISPAGKSGRKFLRDLDFVYTILGVVAAGVGFAAMFFPVALPVVAG
jgi:hypothetical protein